MLRKSAVLLLLPLIAACKEKPAPAMDHSKMPGMAGMSGMDAPVTIPPGAGYTVGDVHFMQGMIAHHAQAIAMSRLAAKAGANAKVMFLSTKIDQSQRSEIVLMQNWLLDHNQTAPDTMSYLTVMMDGMLTPAELKELEDAKGNEFDRKYLTFMIKHHEGALKMVRDLFAAPPSGQEVNIYGFATDVDVTQTAEIAQMHSLLADL